MSLHRYVHVMPKVELHVHLQGALPPETVLELADRNGLERPARVVDALQDGYHFQSFDDFIALYDAICDCIRTPADVETAARAFIARQAADTVVYSEVTYTPTRAIRFDVQLVALNRAFWWGWKTHGVRANVVIDIPAEVDAATGETIARWAISGKGRDVVALGLGGGEAWPMTRHRAAFDLARAAGLPAVPHAGETGGPDHVRQAVDALGAVRLGHGIRAVEDTMLPAYLREQDVTLETCPTSNVALGVVPSMTAHPLPDLVAAGVNVTVNTDDPALFNRTLTDEYLHVADTFGYDAAMLETFTLNALGASFLPDADKARYAQDFRAAFKRLRADGTP